MCKLKFMRTNPKGIAPQSPRLSRLRLGTTLGKAIRQPINPKGVAPSRFPKTVLEK